MSTIDNPVWSVYDALRSAKLNCRYVSCRLQRAERWNTSLEILLAVSAPASAVAGLWFWDEPGGAVAWRVLASIAAVVAVVKPFLKLNEKIKQMEVSLAGYTMLTHDLEEIRQAIFQEKRYGTHHLALLKKAIQREGALKITRFEAREDEKVIAKCQQEVNKELPVQSFFIPMEQP